MGYTNVVTACILSFFASALSDIFEATSIRSIWLDTNCFMPSIYHIYIVMCTNVLNIRSYLSLLHNINTIMVEYFSYLKSITSRMRLFALTDVHTGKNSTICWAINRYLLLHLTLHSFPFLYPYYFFLEQLMSLLTSSLLELSGCPWSRP